MIEIICSIYFFVTFWKRAKSNNKSPFGWGVIGAACFVIISNAFHFAYVIAAVTFGGDRDPIIDRYFGDLWLVAIFLDLGIAFFITKVVLSKTLPVVPERQPNTEIGTPKSEAHVTVKY